MNAAGNFHGMIKGIKSKEELLKSFVTTMGRAVKLLIFIFPHFLICTNLYHPILALNQILVQGSHRAYVMHQQTSELTMMEVNLLLCLDPSATHTNYDFPNDRSCTTAVSTLQGGTIHSYLTQLHFCHPQDVAAKHLLKIITQTLTKWIATDASLSISDVKHSKITLDNLPCSTPDLCKQFGYIQAKDPVATSYIFVHLHTSLSFHLAKKIVLDLITFHKGHTNRHYFLPKDPEWEILGWLKGTHIKINNQDQLLKVIITNQRSIQVAGQTWCRKLCCSRACTHSWPTLGPLA